MKRVLIIIDVPSRARRVSKTPSCHTAVTNVTFVLVTWHGQIADQLRVSLTGTQSKDEPHPQRAPAYSHDQWRSKHSSRTTAEASAQRDCGFPHSCCPCCLSTIVLFFCPRAQDALPHHPTAFRYLPWKTYSGDSGRAWSETAHADGVPPTYPGSGGHDPRGQGARRGAKRSFQRSTNGWAAESGAQGPAWVYCRWFEDGAWHDIEGCSFLSGMCAFPNRQWLSAQLILCTVGKLGCLCLLHTAPKLVPKCHMHLDPHPFAVYTRGQGRPGFRGLLLRGG